MINRFRRVAMSWIVLAATMVLITPPASAQAPTNAQRSAIRSACRSDYMAHCASVPPGGLASLQCLQKNMESLSSSCQTAVRAVEPKEESKAETKPAAEAAKPVTATEKPAADSPRAAKPAGTASARSATVEPIDTPAAAPAAPALMLRPMRPLEEIRVLNMACGADARLLCSAVRPGGGRIVRCLASNAASLSPACRELLSQFAAR